MGSDTVTYQENGQKIKVVVRIETTTIHDILLKIGVQPHLSGYAYMVSALEMVLIEPDLLYHVTKGLYVDVAKKFNVRPANVERAIRHAISVTWLHGNMEYIDRIFKNCINPNKGVPTNTLFLARVYYYLVNGEYK